MPINFKAFVSSTYVDLKEHRAYVIRALRKAGIFVDPMEDWTADSQEPKQFSQERVEGCDLCVLLVAFRRGFVPDGETLSITQLEYRAAVDCGIDVLVFLLDEDAPWPRKFDEIPSDGAEKNISQWRDELKKKHGVGLFGLDPGSVEIAPAVTRWVTERKGEDWNVATLGKDAKDAAKYLRCLFNDTSHIDIRGLRVGRAEAPRFPIDELYIPLTTTSAERTLDGDSAAPTEDIDRARSARIQLQKALKHRRLVIVGDPGAGKTTFVRRIAFFLSQALLGQRPEDVISHLGLSDQPFPVLIRIVDLTRYIAKADERNIGPLTSPSPAWLSHYLVACSDEADTGLSEEYFREHLKNGTAMVLLDGLDEAPSEQDRRLCTRLIESAVNTYEKCRFVVTTRPAAYKDEVILREFTQVGIEPLEDEAIETFLGHWCANLFPENRQRAERHRLELSESLRSRPEIRRIARNPVMLTALAVLHWNEKRLPEQRADLYDSIIGWLSRQRQQRPGRPSPERCVALLQNLALAMHDHPQGRQMQVARHWAAEAIAPLWREVEDPEQRIEATKRFLVQEENDSGIVLGRGDEIRFWHLTFQEFLAARALAARSEDKQSQILFSQPKLYEPEWKESVLLLAGVLFHQGIEKVDGMMSAILDQLGTKASLSDQARCAGLLGAAVRDLQPVKYQPADERYGKTLDHVLGIFDAERSKSVDIKLAIEAADVLGRVGDPRFADENSQDRWITIPAGEFLMGSQSKSKRKPNFDESAEDRESPVHHVCLDAYQIGRYPVTVGEYKRFVDDGGYGDARFWQAGEFGTWDKPDEWERQCEYPNRPVVYVSWYEASAYVAWAGCRLCTEAEWERAARGTDGRIYPWGNQDATASLANFDMNVGHVTPVGVYPQAVSPEGVLDMAGNVLEWCQDWYGAYQKDKVNNPRGSDKGESRVLRGGSFYIVARVLRSAYRYWNVPSYRGTLVGFRVARTYN